MIHINLHKYLNTCVHYFKDFLKRDVILCEMCCDAEKCCGCCVAMEMLSGCWADAGGGWLVVVLSPLSKMATPRFIS